MCRTGCEALCGRPDLKRIRVVESLRLGSETFDALFNAADHPCPEE